MERFDDIPGLQHYWNVGEIPPNVDGGNGNTVIDWPTAYPDTLLNTGPVVPYFVEGQETVAPTYDAGTDFCGSCPAIRYASSPNRRLHYLLPETQEYPNGCTIFMAYQEDSGSNAVLSVYDGETSAKFRTWRGNESSQDYWQISGSATDKEKTWEAERGTPTIIGVVQYTEGDPDPDIVPGPMLFSARKQGETVGKVKNYTWTTGPIRFDRIIIGSRPNVSSNMIGYVPIIVVYERSLSVEEHDQVQGLIMHWLDNGVAPDPAPKPTTAKFGPVLPNDPSATVKFECFVSAKWFAVDDPAGGLGAYGIRYTLAKEKPPGYEGTPIGNIPADNTLYIDGASSEVTVQLRAKATTSYNADGIFTPVVGETVLHVISES